MIESGLFFTNNVCCNVYFKDQKLEKQEYASLATWKWDTFQKDLYPIRINNNAGSFCLQYSKHFS